VKILSFTDRNEKYAKQIFEKIKQEIPSIRIERDFRNTTVQAKVKDAEIMRVPWVILVGDKEEKNKTLAVRHDNKVKYDFKIGDFIKDLKKLIKERK
ncbi:MAG: His/Gly/Thr/Pro-type tRNA ligase C-terminal domain-containing protein, partial [Nanoarchaeota archaeon]